MAKYKNETGAWSRCEILSIEDKASLRIKYIDYGSLDTVAKSGWDANIEL